MKKFLLLLVVCLPPSAAEWKGDVIVLSDAEHLVCVNDGSCVLFTKAEFDAVLRAQRIAVMREAHKACVFGGVGRDI